MLKNLYVVHREKPLLFSDAQVPVWTTCLRSLAFYSEEPKSEGMPGDQLYAQADAYRFILEVICGLHSPVVGETEVFGQFKIFASAWVERDPSRAPLVQRLCADAKEIRSQYLTGQGIQSYGSWIKAHLDGDTVHILGAGQLAREIEPHIAKISKQVCVHARRPDAVAWTQATALSKRAFTDGGHLVVAAPLTAAQIAEWLGDRRALTIFDLRETSTHDPLAPALAVRHHRLAEIFSHIHSTKQKLAPILASVRAEILTRSQKLEALAQIRPLGWDDLCA
jgi:glutamyl-tRNA reductase